MIPAMTRVETDMVGRLMEATTAAADRMDRLGPLLVEPERSGPQMGTIGRHAPESREPWAPQAAAAYWALYFGARELARAMRGAADLRRPSDVCGDEALRIVRNMAPSAQPFILRGVTRTLERLVRQADQVPGIDVDEEWGPLPRLNGRPPRCPYCKTYGLRMLRNKGQVRCFFPGCKDADGKPTRARVERGGMTGDEILIFGDGTMMGDR